MSNAVERQTDFEDQLDALRVENAQLLRQAEISTKRIKKQVETDSTSVIKNGKQPSVVKSSSIIKSRRLPSKLKPQLRQSSLPVSTKASISLPPKIAEDPASASEDVSEIKHQMKRPRDDINDESINSSIIDKSHSETTNNKKRRRNYTTEISNNASNDIIRHTVHRHRYSSHQPSTANMIDGLDSIITPVQSRQNSITPLSDQLPLSYDNDNETLIVPTQFDITTTTTSPFGTEHTYYNTYDNFEHVSSIPALRTPVGRSSSTETNILNQPPPAYDPTSLDILNSIMQDQNLDTGESLLKTTIKVLSLTFFDRYPILLASINLSILSVSFLFSDTLRPTLQKIPFMPLLFFLST